MKFNPILKRICPPLGSYLMRSKGRDFPASSATPLGVPRAILATLHFVPNTVTVPALAIRQGGLVLGWATWVGIHLPKCKRGIDFLLISFPIYQITKTRTLRLFLNVRESWFLKTRHRRVAIFVLSVSSFPLSPNLCLSMVGLSVKF